MSRQQARRATDAPSWPRIALALACGVLLLAAVRPIVAVAFWMFSVTAGGGR